MKRIVLVRRDGTVITFDAKSKLEALTRAVERVDEETRRGYAEVDVIVLADTDQTVPAQVKSYHSVKHWARVLKEEIGDERAHSGL